MKKFSYVLTNQTAMQNKAMQLLSREAARFDSCISLTDGESNALVSQPQSVVNLYMRSGSKVTVFVEGKDEEAAVAAMQNYFVANM
ncbi:MAG: HPr family phosphocarrier protein [Clostridia bacterium]|nr:HPr family phosphocarrier protein [Clostridia bacterium]